MAGQWFSSGTPVSSTNKTHYNLNIAESGVKHHSSHYNVSELYYFILVFYGMEHCCTVYIFTFTIHICVSTCHLIWQVVSTRSFLFLNFFCESHFLIGGIKKKMDIYVTRSLIIDDMLCKMFDLWFKGKDKYILK